MTTQELSYLRPGDRVRLLLRHDPESAFNGAEATVAAIISEGATVRFGDDEREEPVIFDRTEMQVIKG